MENKIFYHYFSGNKYSIKNLQEGNITFSHINYFNDPCEIALLPDEELFVTKNSDMRYKYELLLRVFCFSKTFQNPLMWGHYGNSHEGFCVGYDLLKRFLNQKRLFVLMLYLILITFRYYLMKISAKVRLYTIRVLIGRMNRNGVLL